MTNETEPITNKVTLLGMVDSEPRLSHEMYGEGFYDFFVKVSRLSGQCDIIPVTIPKKLLVEQPLYVGDKIALDGQFRSYNKMDGMRSKLMLTVFVKEFTAGTELFNPNMVELSGYVCKEPIFRTTPLSREICDLLVAVNRAFNKSDYIPCITWGRNARYCRGMSVGTKIKLCGRIQSRKYIKKLSEKMSETRTAYEVSVSRIITENGEAVF